MSVISLDFRFRSWNIAYNITTTGRRISSDIFKIAAASQKTDGEENLRQPAPLQQAFQSSAGGQSIRSKVIFLTRKFFFNFKCRLSRDSPEPGGGGDDDDEDHGPLHVGYLVVSLPAENRVSEDLD